MENLLQEDTTEATKPTGLLNILTILSIIGSIIGYISAVMGFVNAKKNYEQFKEIYDSGKMNDVPAFMKSFVNADAIQLYQKMLDQKVPLLILGLISSTLCLYGAMEMRKLKLQGYYIWITGEVLPYIATLVLIGTMAFSGWALFALVFPAAFILMYTFKRKELTVS